MSLTDAQREMVEAREFGHLLVDLDNVIELYRAMEGVMRVKNKPAPGMDPAVLAQRRGLMDIAYRVLKAELTVAMREFSEQHHVWESVK